YDALARRRVMKGCTRMLRDKLKKRLAPGSIRIVKHLFAKLPEFFNTNDSDRFRDGFAPLLVDRFDVEEFVEWHATPFARLDFQAQRTERKMEEAKKRAKGTKRKASQNEAAKENRHRGWWICRPKRRDVSGQACGSGDVRLEKVRILFVKGKTVLTKRSE